MKHSKERIELHCHVAMKEYEGTITPHSLIEAAKQNEMSAVAIANPGSLRIFQEIPWQLQKGDFFKIIYGVEAQVTGDVLSPFCVTILVKNEEGKKALYELFSMALHTEGDSELQIPLDALLARREHLLIGNASEGGALGKAIREGIEQENLEHLATLFDYLEIQPAYNAKWISADQNDDTVGADEVTAFYNQILIELGDKLAIPVVAVSAEHELTSTEELLAQFDYLGLEKAYQLVVEDTNRLAEQIQRIEPIPNISCPITIPGADQRLHELCKERLPLKYSKEKRKTATIRLNTELNYAISNGYASLYILWYELLSQSFLKKAQYILQGTGAGSILCYLLELSHVDPLESGAPLYSEFFQGIKGNKKPDIDLCVDERIWEKMLDNVKKLPYVENAIRVYDTVAPEQAREKWGQLMLVPKGIRVTDYAPLEAGKEGKEQTFHFTYYYLDHIFFKLDIWAAPICTLLARLVERTTYYPTDEQLRAERICSLFTSPKELGIEPQNKYDIRTGMLGIPGFCNEPMQQLLRKLAPRSYGELVKIEALFQAVGAFEANTCLSKLIATREDVFEILVAHEMDMEEAFHIAEHVRKGLVANGKMDDTYRYHMQQHGVPNWFLKSCEHIRYLPTRAQAAEQIQMKLRLLYYKLYYPDIFYPLFLELFAPKSAEEKRIFSQIEKEILLRTGDAQRK